MQNKLKVLHVVPTLKSDGAEIQLSKIFKQFNYAEVELFTFDMYEKGDSIIDNLEETKVTTAKSVFSIFYLHKFIKKNDFKLVHSHLPKSDIVVGIINKFNRQGLKEKNAYISTGCYYFKNTSLIQNYPEDQFMIENVFEDICKSNKLYAYMYDGMFIDIGIPEDYFKFCEYIKNEH